MKTICKPKIKANKERGGVYRFDVQLWRSYDGGKTFVYAGTGKYCKTDEELRQYIKENCTPLPPFPIITQERQRAYEAEAAEEGTPFICGIHGRACRVLDKPEGANRMLCMNCKLAEFCAAADMMEYARS